MDAFLHYNLQTYVFTSSELPDIEFIYSKYFNKIEVNRFNSTVGKFVGYTEFGIYNAELFNNDPAVLARWRAQKERVCKPNIEIEYRKTLDKTGEDLTQKHILVVSYPQYCRYRSVVARLGGSQPSLLTDQVVVALGGIVSPHQDTHVLYCRDTFDHPTLLHNDSVCYEFALNLKGRPRKKKLSVSQRRDPQGHGKGSEAKGHCHQLHTNKENGATAGKNSKVKIDKTAVSKAKGCSNSSNSYCSINGSTNVNSSSKKTVLQLSGDKKEGRGGRGGAGEGAEECTAEEQAFLVSLYKYMKERKTPIERIPYLGFKQVNLWTMFQAAQKLGGYDLVTARRQWKNIYDELGGNPGSTSAATCTRRHYERLILPYERFTKGEEDKPLPPVKSRKQEVSASMETSSNVSGPTPKTKLTNGVKNQDLKPLPDRGDAEATRVESTQEMAERASKFSTRLETLHPPHTDRDGQRRREEEGENGRDTHTVPKDGEKEEEDEGEEEEKKWRRSGWGPQDTGPSCLLTPPITKDDNTAFHLTPAEVLHASHPAVDQWQQDQSELKGRQCVEAASPPRHHRTLQFPALPDPVSEHANLSRGDDAIINFTSPLHTTRVQPRIMSPLAKKKLLSQVTSTGLQNHNHFPSSFSPLPSLVGFTAGVTAEATGQPAAATSSLPAATVSRPSVIQRTQGFMSCRGEIVESRGERNRARERGERLSSPFSHSHEFNVHHPPPTSIPRSHPQPHPHGEEAHQWCFSPPLCTPEMSRTGSTPLGSIGDLHPSSQLHGLYKKPENCPSQEQGQALNPGLSPGQELRKGLYIKQVQGLSEGPSVESKQHQQTDLRFPSQLVNADLNKTQQQLHSLSFANELASDESRELSLPRDPESATPNSNHDPLMNLSTHTSLQDTSSSSVDSLRGIAVTSNEQPTDLSLPKSSSLKQLPHHSSSQPLPHHIMQQDSARLSHNAISAPLFQNGHSTLALAYPPRACLVPPMGISTTHTHSPSHNPTLGKVGGSHPRAPGKLVNDHAGEGGRGVEQRSETKGEREREGQDEIGAAELYSKNYDPNHTTRLIRGSKVPPQSICATRPLKRSLEELEHGAFERKIRAVTPMHTSTSSASSCTSPSLSSVTSKDVVPPSSPHIKTGRPEETDDDMAHTETILRSLAAVMPEQLYVHMGSSFTEGDSGGQKRGAATSLALHPTPITPHIYPTVVYPARAFSLSELQDLCRDPLGISLTTGYPTSQNPLHPFQHLKNQSLAVLSPLVPPFAIHSFMMQRQLLAQAAASPTHTYGHPAASAASYGDLLPHGLCAVSVNPQTAFSPSQLNSVHSSTKLS
ncbi:AT-rich interactive domain-containing protein 5B-like [Lampris incognitus]|uniref:AT-rich interactive domain-containing protein 5B-like n=1 Tax=Lampris incognitus TaxID=2546036 RepID=UPI0024B57D76|nr:AT-rich interactive domain-containing protein 5B-like [Lampris incognitus]